MNGVFESFIHPISSDSSNSYKCNILHWIQQKVEAKEFQHSFSIALGFFRLPLHMVWGMRHKKWFITSSLFEKQMKNENRIFSFVWILNAIGITIGIAVERNEDEIQLYANLFKFVYQWLVIVEYLKWYDVCCYGNIIVDYVDFGNSCCRSTGVLEIKMKKLTSTTSCGFRKSFNYIIDLNIFVDMEVLRNHSRNDMVGMHVMISALKATICQMKEKYLISSITRPWWSFKLCVKCKHNLIIEKSVAELLHTSYLDAVTTAWKFSNDFHVNTRKVLEQFAITCQAYLQRSKPYRILWKMNSTRIWFYYWGFSKTKGSNKNLVSNVWLQWENNNEDKQIGLFIDITQ